jgi:hypothetical protein
LTELFLERDFEDPLTPEEIRAMAGGAAGCFGRHRVAWLGSCLSPDGHRLLCRFRAPDAESARVALREVEADVRRLWPGTVHEAPDAPPDAVPNVLVERSFDASVPLEEVQALEDAGGGCLERHRVRFVRTFFSFDRRRMICLYEAPDAESVRLAQREAGMPVERVWAFERIGP